MGEKIPLGADDMALLQSLLTGPAKAGRSCPLNNLAALGLVRRSGPVWSLSRAGWREVMRARTPHGPLTGVRQWRL